jgi:hypothetical protein
MQNLSGLEQMRRLIAAGKRPGIVTRLSSR